MPIPTLDVAQDKRAHQIRRLRDILRCELLAGAFPDRVLPAESQLMADYGCARAIVRGALDALRHEGLVERLQGAGTFAMAERFALRLVELHGVDAEPEGAAFTAEILDMDVVPMAAPVAGYLDEEIGTPCLRLEYLGYNRGRIVALCTNYLRFPEAEAVRRTPFNSHWYALMTAAGLDVAGTELLIEAVLADDERMAELLGVESHAPVLSIQQVIRDSSGRPFDFAILRCRADRFALQATGIGPTLKGTA